MIAEASLAISATVLCNAFIDSEDDKQGEKHSFSWHLVRLENALLRLVNVSRLSQSSVSEFWPFRSPVQTKFNIGRGFGRQRRGRLLLAFRDGTSLALAGCALAVASRQSLRLEQSCAARPWTTAGGFGGTCSSYPRWKRVQPPCTRDFV